MGVAQLLNIIGLRAVGTLGACDACGSYTAASRITRRLIYQSFLTVSDSVNYTERHSALGNSNFHV